MFEVINFYGGGGDNEAGNWTGVRMQDGVAACLLVNSKRIIN